jgi:hypothetical protein
MSKLSSRSPFHENAIWVPSGEKAGDRSNPRNAVNWTTRIGREGGTLPA